MSEQLFRDSLCRLHFDDQFKSFLESEELGETNMVYELPTIEDRHFKLKTKQLFKTKPTDVRIPARLCSPLIPYPAILKEPVLGLNAEERNMVHSHHFSQMSAIEETFDLLVGQGAIPNAPIVYDMSSLKRFAKLSYSSREKLIGISALEFARRATTHELSICATNEVKADINTNSISKYTPFVIMIQRLRIHIAKEKDTSNLTGEVPKLPDDEASFRMFENGVYIYGSSSESHNFVIMCCGGHFRIYHKSLGYWFAGPHTYLDYIFTLCDIMNNLDVISNCSEYDWASGMLKLMILFAEADADHNDQVNFMKAMEGFLLNISDYDVAYAMNWRPLIVAINDLWELDIRISGETYDIGILMMLLDKKDVSYPKNSFLCRFIKESWNLTRPQIQEISALHKLIFYAEVNARTGVEKFLKRVHTKRVIDKVAVKNITRLAKMQFFIAYAKKHHVSPNIIGHPDKVNLLRMYVVRSEYAVVENLTLSWWDDIKIFDCMDNTLTSDPLEFAKDKGALKPEISHGPGDSRKELLQVIEKPVYKLEDFFSSRSFKPREPIVYVTNQMEKPIIIPNPTRLIEKEREQKVDARLFGNAELSDKHALSLVATQMKKALSYFDEQLMTPTDKKRKQLIHNAARDLAQDGNYSLLLDIEGHNQSMQSENTSELCEFMGHLFGQEDWGKLPDYFSQLHVYHYDEYLDSVIVSEGQLGGIEGWLNPLWTLHTTLMMKLMRIMTDLVIKTIMVYSDDVNAIINIQQPSEAVIKSTFSKIMKHCSRFGMTVKYSQTNLSKHRITMLRQHYADGVRADSTLKRLISVSAGNNPVIVSEELEVAGICSSASSALELSNHHEACAYLKNYKIALLLSRLPQMILSHPDDGSIISQKTLPDKLSSLLYYTKDDKTMVNLDADPGLHDSVMNDICSYLGVRRANLDNDLIREGLSTVYGKSVSESRFVDNADRVLYLQIYDLFLQDLLFFWTYMPASLGGLGGSLHINLMLSGHSVGMSKSLHYLFEWIKHYSSDAAFFMDYLGVTLSIDESKEMNMNEDRVITSNWPSDMTVCPATSSVQQSIKSMVRSRTNNKHILKMFELADQCSGLASDLVEIFRDNMHTRIAQFYHENSSIHFCDLLLNKIETSSGLLVNIRNLKRLRTNMSFRTIENIRISSRLGRTMFVKFDMKSDVVSKLLDRKMSMFRDLKFIEVEEVLYDDKISETTDTSPLLTIRRCSPMHYRNGIRVYDDPKMGNEVLYKGELVDDDKMLSHKEELLVAKLVAVTKWFMMKYNFLRNSSSEVENYDCVRACNLALETLTNQRFTDLVHQSPTEIGGEILHRIPNMRFSSMTYIRSEMNVSLKYTTDLNQSMITRMDLVDSNINFDYVRMRFLVSAIVRDKYSSQRRLVTRYNLTNLTGIKDVQFVEPKRNTYVSKRKYISYSSTVGHTLSILRFRYLAHAYLSEENENNWGTMPKVNDIESLELIGDKFIDDIIYKYLRNLDKEHMLPSMSYLNPDSWKPLIEKVKSINPMWNSDGDMGDIDYLSSQVTRIFSDRNILTTIAKSERIKLMLQSMILDDIRDRAPSDNQLHILATTYSKLMNTRRHSSMLSQKLAKYQQILSDFEEHKIMLSKYIILEYIAHFHLHFFILDGQVMIDPIASVSRFENSDFLTSSLSMVNLDLQVRMLIVGIDTVQKVSREFLHEIRDELVEMTSDLALLDTPVPTNLPSMKRTSKLTGLEPVPDSLDDIMYNLESIPQSAMITVSDLIPVCKFAQKCSNYGSDPSTYFSYTGSDSLGAQLGLFRALLSHGYIDKRTRICDLTSGRGDGAFALNHLGLQATSFSRPGTFENLLSHPNVEIRDNYDIFDGSTLKFLYNFDFIHIDISFTGNTEADISDLLSLIEDQQLAYSVRLNSVQIDRPTSCMVQSTASYTYSIAYCSNSTKKPYQIYLIGVPISPETSTPKVDMKDTIAFRSLISGYSRLMYGKQIITPLPEYQPNSYSVYLPTDNLLDDFLISVLDKSVKDECLYYCERYITEVYDSRMISLIPDLCDDDGQKLFGHKPSRIADQSGDFNMSWTLGDVGNVSVKSRPYHERHIAGMSSGDPRTIFFEIDKCTQTELIYLRSRHPVGVVRSRANVCLGLQKFCYSEYLSGHDALENLYHALKSETSIRPTLYQKELNSSIELLALSALTDNFDFGVDYTMRILLKTKGRDKSVLRMIKAYKSLSYLYHRFRGMLSSGRLNIRHHTSLENKFKDREIQRYKYKPSKPPEDVSFTLTTNFSEIITNSLDKLFENLSNFAVSQMANDDEGSMFDMSGIGQSIDVSQSIDDAINRLGLRPSGPHGFIDLGDTDLYENPDW
jgi:hypothetical protein